MNENNKHKEDLLAEERELESALLNGEYGDWKVAKYYEYILLGLPAPYNMAPIHAKRQEMRDRINEIREELKSL